MRDRVVGSDEEVKGAEPESIPARRVARASGPSVAWSERTSSRIQPCSKAANPLVLSLSIPVLIYPPNY